MGNIFLSNWIDKEGNQYSISLIKNQVNLAYQGGGKNKRINLMCLFNLFKIYNKLYNKTKNTYKMLNKIW